MTSDEIRDLFIEFFVARDHKRVPSGSLIPATHDPSVLLTTAGMHPLKPYFLGQEKPPHHRLTSCQKCFRSPDIDVVGTTARHLTFFEMLGNFSIGDYFKQGAVEYAWDLSLNGFKFAEENIWITVFEGDPELGLGPDEEAIEAWESVGVPRERIVLCPRSENFWQAGPTGPCGPCSELYLDRGVEFGKPDDLPGEENERFLEYWNLVFMQFNQEPVNTLMPLPAQNIDTGLGLNRMAMLQQGKASIFETDQFAPLIKLSEELSGKSYEDGDEAVKRAMRILADHTRGATFMVADGVVPSNEDRGYVLRRIMRRAVQQGRSLGFQPGFLTKFSDVVTETMGREYPDLHEQHDSIVKWLASEEEAFGHTLEQGSARLEELLARAKDAGAEGIASQDAFLLHDTFGFPFDLTRELAAEHGLGVDEAGFSQLMDEARARARQGGRRSGAEGADLREQALSLAGAAGFQTEFTGYAALEQPTTVGAVEGNLAKLVESPFYATGGGQIADSGVIECEGGDCRARVADVIRIGDDQAVVVEVLEGTLEPGERVVARVDRAARHATEANHTATHLLHAALRGRLGSHVRQAGSYVGPDKLRFDFAHGQGLSDEELADVEDEVNRRILENHRVRALTTTIDEARSLGAMALFGEKYGDIVRMVEIGDGDFSRELCGGTHVRSTAEIGLFKVTQETSSAANVRRIEAITGPEAVALMRRHDAELEQVAATLRTRPDQVADAVERAETKRKEAEKALKSGAVADANGASADDLAGRAIDHGDVKLLLEQVDVANPDALLDLADRLKGKLGDAAIVLGTAHEGRVHIVASVAPALVERGVKAGAVVKAAAEVTGGGGGGKDTMARAGGKDPEKLPEAIAAARAAIESALDA